MASISSVLGAATDPSSAASTSAASTSNSSTSAGATSTDALGNETTFLQLLVTEIQNQDPTQPMDSTTFLTQLAQFSQLEQTVGIRQDIENGTYDAPGTPATSAATTPATSATDPTLAAATTDATQAITNTTDPLASLTTGN